MTSTGTSHNKSVVENSHPRSSTAARLRHNRPLIGITFANAAEAAVFVATKGVPS
ncbi:MAG: hypothetical protein KDA44_21545 [Planctomycetales bacterium]|nr:hypothetical protein [Planctomycetales bacterium]